MILIVSPEKPMLRTPKGNIQKKATIKAYGAEIDALYVLLPLHTTDLLSLHFRKDTTR